MDFIDSHCHLDHEQFKDDLPKVVERMKAVGTQAITMGGGLRSNRAALELAKRFKGSVHAALGVSPFEAVKEDLEENLEFMEKHVKEAVAVGETGLDYHYFSKEEDKERQRKAFLAQLAFAETHDLPCSIHARKAEKEVLETLKGFKCRKILHCFLKPAFLDDALRGDCLVSVPTLKSSASLKIMKKTPLERLLCETDSPFLWEGRNEPANVASVYARAAGAKGKEAGEVKEKIYRTAKELFGLK